jgi:hypothetical protein
MDTPRLDLTMFIPRLIPSLVAFLVFSVFWAVTGHLLYLFYGFLWRSGRGLLGFVKKTETPATHTEGEEVGVLGIRVLVSRYGTQLLGVGGAVLSILGFFWLLGDVVADEGTQRIIQLGSLLLLTAVLLLAGYRCGWCARIYWGQA